MNRNTHKINTRNRRKHKLMLRRISVLCLVLAAVGLFSFLGWQIYNGISAAITTGDQPVSEPTVTTISTTTTTHPTITENAQLTSPRIMVYDITHSSILYSKNVDERSYPASLTKLLTAMIVSDECEPQEEFTVGSEISLVQLGSSRSGIQAGYRLTRDMIIDALLLKSGNDAAYTIAAHVGRKLSGDSTLSDLEALFAFTDKMNAKAEELGLLNSHFSNPDGYFAADHYTTASDMLKIAESAMQYENLRQTVAKTSTSHTLLSGQKLVFNNTNAILSPSNPYYFEGATGMKTGFTDEAGHCVVASAQRNGVEVLVVVMGGITSDDRWKDTVTLLEDAFAIHAE